MGKEQLNDNITVFKHLAIEILNLLKQLFPENWH